MRYPELGDQARAYIIEVVEENGRLWTAMASEPGAIMRELESAPPAQLITIYEWELAKANNPLKGILSMWPEWRRVRTYPWRAVEGPSGR